MKFIEVGLLESSPPNGPKGVCLAPKYANIKSMVSNAYDDLVQQTYTTLVEILTGQGRPEADLALVDAGFEYAKLMHASQTRKTGEPYITHPTEVATILAQIPMDTPTVVAALLHDVLEDTEATADDIKKRFGPEILKIVEGVTKLGKFQFESKQERHAENFRRMFLAMAEDIRVVLLKLCDRLHNMRTLEHLPPEKQLKKARETLEVFAPLANRMGMGKIKAELEDLSLKYMDPEEYKHLVNQVEDSKSEWEGDIKDMCHTLEASMAELNIDARVYGRVKNYFSIYKKMKVHHKQFQDIYDLSALRIIVKNEKDCYEVLGVVHSNFKPIPGRFKDYVAMPKSNLYQSLHTTVIGPIGRPIEVQIRTDEMHRIAEYGIAAHWKYKESGGSNAVNAEEQKLSWLKQMLEMKEENGDAQEYVDNVKLDLFRDEVFVFTPSGDVFDLPQGATPVDFAYRVHTQVGNTCTGSLVNSKIVPLDYQLRNGDIVEIMVNKKASPRLDWIKFVQTQHARTAIRQWYKKNFKEDHIEQGTKLLEAELTHAGYDEAVKNGKLLEVAHALNYTKLDDMLLALGYGELTMARIINRFNKDKRDEKAAPVSSLETLQNNPNIFQKRKPNSKDLIEGLDGMLYHMAKCCSPLPGDNIIGVVTRSRGVMIHRDDCINLDHVNPERQMTLKWTDRSMGNAPPTPNDKKSVHSVRLEVLVIDRMGIFKDVLARVADINTNISNARVKLLSDNTALIELAVDIADLDHLDRVKRTIAKLSDVISVTRAQARTVRKTLE